MGDVWKDSKRTVLIVDDDQTIRRVVALVLQREDYKVVPASNGREALEAVLHHSPNLVILDLSLPGELSGLDVLRNMRSWYQGPVMILSGNGEELMVIDALDAGADDYLTKPFRPSEMLARIRALLRRYRNRNIGPRVIEAGELKVDLAKRRVIRDGREIRLTRTEFEILVYLARNRDRVVTSKMILDRIWGPTHGDYIQTLRVHVGHLRKKIEPNPAKPRYILTEPSVGYRFSVPSSARAEMLAS